jgi:D-glycero-beta-D-manno-heptose-7-phosphate kinase
MNIIVIGDIILDKYLWGNVTRISPEAPVPIVLLDSITHNLGGAANVAQNIVNLGAKATLIGLVGVDEDSVILTSLIKEKNIIPELLTDASYSTIVKTRVMGRSQQMIRIDKERVGDFCYTLKEKLTTKLTLLIPKATCVILSDYAKGMFVDKETSKWIITTCNKNKVPIFVDPKGVNWSKYEGATCVTPNKKEFNEIIKEEQIDHNDFLTNANKLKERFSINNLLVTLGSEGMTLFTNREKHFNSVAKTVYDVSGAGDTVIATMAYYVAKGYTMEEAVEIANIAAGIVISKVGTQPINKEELKNESKHLQIHLK